MMIDCLNKSSIFIMTFKLALNYESVIIFKYTIVIFDNEMLQYYKSIN